MCDDVAAEISRLAAKGASCTAIQEERWGSLTQNYATGRRQHRAVSAEASGGDRDGLDYFARRRADKDALSAGGFEGLIQVPENIVEVLEANREAD
jgi:hypothetical protein